MKQSIEFVDSHTGNSSQMSRDYDLGEAMETDDALTTELLGDGVIDDSDIEEADQRLDQGIDFEGVEQ